MSVENEHDDHPLPDIEIARYGVRTFRVRARRTLRGQRGYLYPVAIVRDEDGAERHWQNGVCRAECLTGTIWLPAHNKIPSIDCTCGVYAATSLEGLCSQYAEQTFEIVAVIAAEGRTILGPRGMRTEAARVVAYWGRRAAAKIAARQFPEARRYRNILEMLSDHQLSVHRPPLPEPAPGADAMEWARHISQRALQNVSRPPSHPSKAPGWWWCLREAPETF